MSRSAARSSSSAGVRSLRLEDQAPNAEIVVNGPAYELSQMVSGKCVLDVGCGAGKNRSTVESAGGTWVGLEPYPGGAHTIVGDGQNLPFADRSFDVVIMDSVLEHVPDVAAAFGEVGRVLRPGGCLVGYAAFMECFHEISYSHLSFKALEYYADQNQMVLRRLSGGSRFGIDYHLQVLLYPIPFGMWRPLVARSIRLTFRAKSKLAYLVMRVRQRRPKHEAARLAERYYEIECLRQSNGFSFIIERSIDEEPRMGQSS